MNHTYFCAQAQWKPTKNVRAKQKKSALVYVLLHRGTCVRRYYARIHLNSSKIDRSAFRNGRGKKQWLRTARKTCVPLVFVLACFVFVSVFISDEGGPRRVCQAPVSMQAIISPVLWSPMYVCKSAHVFVSVAVLGYNVRLLLHILLLCKRRSPLRYGTI